MELIHAMSLARVAEHLPYIGHLGRANCGGGRTEQADRQDLPGTGQGPDELLVAVLDRRGQRGPVRPQIEESHWVLLTN